MLARLLRKGNPRALLVGMQTGAATVENCMEFPKKIKSGTAFWPSDSTSGNISIGTQNTNSKEPVHLNVHSSITYNSQVLEATQVPISKRMDQNTVVHLHNAIPCSRKKGAPTLCNSMDGTGEHYAKWNKPVRERQIPRFHSYVESNEQNKLTTSKETDS